MANLADVMEKYVKEEFSPLLRDALIEVTSLFRDIQDRSIGVERSGLGRDWQVKHIFVTSYAGAVKAAADSAIEGDNVAYTDAGGTVYAQSVTWPTIGESVAPAFVHRTIQLKRWKGNLYVPHDLMRADSLDSSLANMLQLTVKQTARNLAHQRANNFLAPDDQKTLAVVASCSASTETMTVTCSAGSRMRRLQPGMLVDVIDNNSNAYDQKCNASTVIVKSVDPTSKVCVLVQIAGGAWTYTPAVSDYIVLKDSYTIGSGHYGHGPAGLLEWMIASGTLYGIALATYPQFKSIVETLGSAASLTDAMLRARIGPWLDNHAPAQYPDTILTTGGVLADYVAEIGGNLRSVDINGEVIRRRGGHAGGVTYEHEGLILTFRTDGMFPGNTAAICKLGGGNIRRYVPPKLVGTGSEGQFGGDVEFVAPLGGSKGIWLHAYNADAALTPYVQAPFEVIEEYCPEVPQGYVIKNLNEYTQ